MARAFIIRPFNKKTDSSGQVVDFERVHQELIAPALEAAGLGAVIAPMSTGRQRDFPPWQRRRPRGSFARSSSNCAAPTKRQPRSRRPQARQM